MVTLEYWVLSLLEATMREVLPKVSPEERLSSVVAVAVLRGGSSW